MEQIIYTMPLSEFTSLIRQCVREELVGHYPRTTNEDELLKIEDAVKLFRVSKVTLHKWRKKGLLPYHRISSRIYFKKSELNDALQYITRKRATYNPKTI
jgi:hypothetical protein